MAEEQTPPAAEPQAGEAPAIQPQPQAGKTTPEPQAGDGHTSPETMSLDEAKKLRSEAFNLRKRIKQYEDAEEEKRLATLGEVERSKAEVSKAQQLREEAESRVKQYQQQLATAHVRMAAQSMGIIDPEMAALAIQSKLEFGEDGMPTNIDVALKELIKNKPYLAPKPAEPPAPSPAQSAPTPTAPQLPANNPDAAGRLAITPTLAKPGRPPSFDEVYAKTKRQ
jgi:hypothetical protein